MKKPLLIILSLVFCTTIIKAQNDYYQKDSSTHAGVKLIDRGDKDNAQFCKVQNGEEVTEYSPFEVKEYGFKDGRVYISKEVNIGDSEKRVFLERLVKGTLSLYYYNGKEGKIFFVSKKDGELIKLRKKKRAENTGYQEQLNQLTSDFYYAADAVKVVRYNRKELIRLVDGYNKRNLPIFGFLRYGIFAGYGSEKLTTPAPLSGTLDKFGFDKEYGFTAGLFIEAPIINNSFAFKLELFFTQNAYSYNVRTFEGDFDFLANTKSLNIPILFKYTLPTKRIRPFINAGGMYSYNIQAENTIYKAAISDNVIEILEHDDKTYFSNNQIGYALGAGVEYKLNHRNSLIIEVRHFNLFGFEGSETLGNSGLFLFTGFNF